MNTAWGTDVIPDPETKIPQTEWHSQKRKWALRKISRWVGNKVKDWRERILMKNQQELGPADSSCVQILGSLCLPGTLKRVGFQGTQSCVLWPWLRFENNRILKNHRDGWYGWKLETARKWERDMRVRNSRDEKCLRRNSLFFFNYVNIWR